MKKTLQALIIALAVIAVALSGCTEKGPGSGELKTMMIDSVKNLNTYQFTIDSTQNLELINKTTSNSSSIAVSSTGKGAVNLTARTMGISQVVSLQTDGKSGVAPMQSDTYLINDTIYMRLGNNWTKLSIPNPEMLWDQQNVIRRDIELINLSTIELTGSESVEGQDCYKINVKPDMDVYASILQEQLSSTLPVAYMNLTQLYKTGSMEWTAWVTKDSHLLKKNDVNLTLTITPDVLGLPTNTTNSFEMHVKTSAVSTFEGYNAPVQIALPAEAQSASTLPIVPLQTAPATSA